MSKQRPQTGVLGVVENTPLSSKKFLMLLMANLCWFGVLTMLIVDRWGNVWTWQEVAVFGLLVFGLVCLQIVYIGGQAALDAFTRTISIKAHIGNSAGSPLPETAPTVFYPEGSAQQPMGGDF